MRRSLGSLVWSPALLLAGIAGCGDTASVDPIASSAQCVVGGEGATTEAAPGLGRLLDDGAPTCSATLIAKRWALTAGHCVADQEPEQYQVVFGADAEGESLAQRGWSLRGISMFPGWNTDDGVLVDDDLALLEFDEPIDVDGVSPATLAAAGRSCGGEFYGWGATSASKLGSEQLQGVRLRIRAAATCGEHLSALGEPQLAERLLCAGAEDGSPGACHGDSGGPLFTTRGNEPVVVGIAVGGGPECDEYSLFASVEYYQDWIYELLGR